MSFWSSRKISGNIPSMQAGEEKEAEVQPSMVLVTKGTFSRAVTLKSDATPHDTVDFGNNSVFPYLNLIPPRSALLYQMLSSPDSLSSSLLHLAKGLTVSGVSLLPPTLYTSRRKIPGSSPPIGPFHFLARTKSRES